MAPASTRRMGRGAIRLRRPAAARSRGQALILGLIFLVCACIVVLLLFNSAILTTTKSQLQNAADAGAYSAAVLQARDHNFSAYANRAMIANQVAVAQFVSLKSYFEDADRTHTRANSFLHDTVYRLFPSFAPAWDAAKNVPVDSANSALDSLAPTAVTGLDALIEALMQAQQIHHMGTMADMMFVADDVVKKNDPKARVSSSAFMVGDAVLKVKAWGNDATKQFRANDSSAEANRFADAVVSRDSEDLFIRNRLSVPNAAWASNVKAYLCPAAVATFTMFSFAHAGGTILSSDKRRWEALDATMGGGFASCTWLVPCWFGLCPFTVTVPFVDLGLSLPIVGGHGGAQAGGGGYGNPRGYGSNAFESWLYGFALTSPAAVPAWYRYATGPGSSLDTAGRGGLQDNYRDVADPTGSTPANQTPGENGGRFPVTVEVERPQNSVRLSTDVLPNSDKLRLQGGFKGNTMRALASAHAYFYRPRSDSLAQFTRNGWRRSDGRTEVQNLFSPYWQARLAPTSAGEEGASALGQ